ncbi:MAG TPA: hypothetical protein VJQ46_15810 [Gemmatimonadales bacterium]|nr:hypothetical protein [Gemmatimonadales bacterium]
MKSVFAALLSLAALPLALGFRAPVAPSVTVTAHDYSLELPDTLPAGAVTLRLVNQGKELHHIWMARMEGGHTIDDVLKGLAARQPLPSWLQDIGGPNAPRPEGGEATVTVTLEPGTYVVACLIPSKDGVSHMMKGMVRQVTVVTTSRPARTPKADAVMTLRDYTFFLSRPLSAGKHVLEVRNEGTQWHEFELVQLAPGKTPQDVVDFIERGVGTPPGLPLGGVSPLAVGRTSYMHVDLEPGRYALICFLTDRKDGRAHYQHGMMQEFQVSEKLAAR